MFESRACLFQSIELFQRLAHMIRFLAVFIGFFRVSTRAVEFTQTPVAAQQYRAHRQIFSNSDRFQIVFLRQRLIVCQLLCCVSLITAAQASENDPGRVPEPVTIDELEWVSPPAIAGLRFSWIQGGENNPGLYVLRVKLLPDARIPPHSHPDQRFSTILSGTLYVGFGEVFDPENMIAIEAGNAYVAAANVPHYIWAKEGAVEYQETGLGPTATRIIDKN